jgi:hypothetical protein
LSKLDAEKKKEFLDTKWKIYSSFAIQTELNAEVQQIQSSWAPMATVKPVVPVVPAPVKKDEKKKSKRHTCGKGASYLVMGASTMVAASMLLY